MSNVTIKVEGVAEVEKRLANLKRYTARIQNAPANLLIRQNTVKQSLEQAQKLYSTPKNKPRYPLRWKSDKQRIAVIIKLKEEGNLPYKRTGRQDRSWRAVVKAGEVTISNEAKDPRTGQFYAPFTIGAWQQPFHKDTGWTKRTTPIEKQILKPITDDLLTRAKALIESSKHG